MNNQPSKHDLVMADAAEAIEEAISDCVVASRLLSNELARDCWNTPSEGIENLVFLSAKIKEQLMELEARFKSQQQLN